MTDNRQRRYIASLVRRARRASDWTQRDLADRAQVAPGTVNSIENARSVRPGSLGAVLETLGIPAPGQPEADDTDVQLAIDMMRQWLSAMEAAERAEAILALTRFTVLGGWRQH